MTSLTIKKELLKPEYQELFQTLIGSTQDLTLSVEQVREILDSLGRVFIYFVQKDVQKLLRCGHNRATAFMRELERFGFIERMRQGLGKSAMICVKNFSSCKNDIPENVANETVEPAQNKEKIRAGDREDASNQALFSAPAEAVKTARIGRLMIPGRKKLS